MLDIIIVNWNSGTLLNNAVKSILESNTDNINFNIIIVDNASTDNSLDTIPINNKIHIVKNKDNKGFGFACNQAIKISNKKFILLFNPDAEMSKNTIKESLNYIISNPKITVMGCKQIDKSGNILRTCSRFITLKNYINKLSGLSKFFKNTFPEFQMTEWNHINSKIVDHVMGSFYLIKRSKLLEIGVFDEDYFMYYEDLDLSYRIKKNGGTIFFNSEIEIFHESGGTSKNIKAKRLFYSLQGLLIFSRKNLGIFEHSILSFLVIFIEPIIRIVLELSKLNFSGILEIIIGYTMLYKKMLLKK